MRRASFFQSHGYLLRRSAAISQIHGTYISNAHGFGYITATVGALRCVRAVDALHHHAMACGGRHAVKAAAGFSIIYALKDFARRVISSPTSTSTSEEHPTEQKPRATWTMMEGSSSSATAIEHGSEDAAPLIRPGGGGGVASTLPVDLERLGNVYVDYSFCCWLVLMGSSVRWLVRAVVRFSQWLQHTSIRLEPLISLFLCDTPMASPLPASRNTRNEFHWTHSDPSRPFSV